MNSRDQRIACLRAPSPQSVMCPPERFVLSAVEPPGPPERQTGAMVFDPAKWHMLKITLSRSIWLLCGAALIAAASIAAARVPVSVPADDPQTCREASGEAAIAACSRAIAS